jgi:histidinol-phosphate aminotransferase
VSRFARWLRPNIRDLQQYASARGSGPVGNALLLDANENSLAADGPYSLGRYPDPVQRQLKAAIARTKNVSPAQTFIGNGSDEAIDLLVRAVCRPGRDRVIVMPPTYGMYEVTAALNDVGVDRVPLDPAFQMNRRRLRAKFSPRTRIVFVCSPNNPTGNCLDPTDIERLLLDFDSLVVLDEAYIDFCPDHSWLSRLDDFDNLVILQTLSKAWGLASIRVGMAFAAREIITVLSRMKPPYNVGGVSQSIALQALRDPGMMQKQVDALIEGRGQLCDGLAELAVVENVYPSDANFVLVRVGDAARVTAYLRERGIIVRDRSAEPGCEGCVRITVGTSEQNQQLLQTLRECEVML